LSKISDLIENKISLIEDLLCELINEDFVHAKIDRLTGIV